MSKFAAPPDVIRWSTRSGNHGDCVVAALELAIGVTYEQALQASAAVASDVLTNGLSWGETVRVARRLGERAEILRAGRYDIDDATGLLHVYQPRDRSGSSHAVYLWDGRIVEPKADRQQLWLHPDQFLKHYGYRAGSLVVIKGRTE